MADTVPEGFDVLMQDMTRMVVRNDLRAAKVPEDRILAELERQGYPPDAVFAMKLALEEAMTNAVKHGNRNDPTRHVTVCFHIDGQRAIVMVRDQGTGFCPTAVPDPTQSQNLERPFGRGIMLITSYMTRVHYSRDGNEVWMLKQRNDVKP